MYEKYAAVGAKPAALSEENNNCKPEETTPRVFGLSEEEQQKFLAQLSPEAREMMQRRDAAVAEVLQRALSELQVKHFLDEEFAKKGRKYGFKDSKEWIEKLITAEDMLEQNPEQTLRFLAGSYGIEWAAGGAPLQPAAELLLTRVAEQLQQLQNKFDQKERHEASLRASADDAKRAKEAAFAPQGKKPAPEDFSKLTTREILERQFALLDD